MRWLLVLCALLAASAAAAFPIIDGNRFDRSRTYMHCDTLKTPAGPSGRSRTIYLISGTTMQADSALNVWRNGGAVPTFRRIQGIQITCPDGASVANMVVTFHRTGATSAGNRMMLQPYVWTYLPIEADSIVVKSNAAATQYISYCVW